MRPVRARPERSVSSYRGRVRRVVVGLLVLVVCVGCAASGSASAQAVALPPPGAGIDYQLGGAGRAPSGVEVLVRDRSEDPDPDRYSVCYLNAFQTQAGERRFADLGLVLLDRGGRPVLDPDWPEEALLDTSTGSGRDQILAVVSEWIDGCAERGFEAIELDNLDSAARSGGALQLSDNLVLASDLVSHAHSLGLAVAQKNTAELGAAGRSEIGFDFAVVEECAAYEECSAFTDVYGQRVYDIEYTDSQGVPFATACARYGSALSMVLRDRDLVRADEEGYVRASCP